MKYMPYKYKGSILYLKLSSLLIILLKRHRRSIAECIENTFKKKKKKIMSLRLQTSSGYGIKISIHLQGFDEGFFFFLNINEACIVRVNCIYYVQGWCRKDRIRWGQA